MWLEAARVGIWLLFVSVVKLTVFMSCSGAAETEQETAERLDLAGGSSRPRVPFQMTPPSPDSRKKSRGIMKLFGR